MIDVSIETKSQYFLTSKMTYLCTNPCYLHGLRSLFSRFCSAWSIFPGNPRATHSDIPGKIAQTSKKLRITAAPV